MPTHARARVLAAVAGLALLAPAGAAEAMPTDGTAGSRGIGDPYYADAGNGGYDVDHYGIAVSYAPRRHRLTGTTRIRAHATQELSRFDLDFRLHATAVRVNDRAATFRRDGHELVVTPAKPLRAGQSMTVQVTYRGRPSRLGSRRASPWVQTADGVAVAGKPESAAWWYPADDHPLDKATYDVRITVDRHTQAVSNGVLVSKQVRHGRRTWHWRETDPMAPYLAFFVVGQLDVTRSRVDGRPMVNAVAPGPRREGRWALAALERTPDVVDFGSKEFGAYPFHAIGGVAAAVPPGTSTENQTRPVYARSFWHTGPNVYPVVHQVAHQWFGDSVSVDSWRDIWLSEGLAAYAEWRWSEMHAGGTGRQLFRAAWDAHDGDRDFWSVPVGDPGPGEESSLAVLDRGAMTLQALRTRIGGPAFFSVLRDWVAQHRYGNASTDDFVAMAEAESREDLGAFFDTWLYEPRRPEPTRANGFPQNFDDRARSESEPPSWGPISRTHELLASGR